MIMKSKPRYIWIKYSVLEMIHSLSHIWGMGVNIAGVYILLWYTLS